VFRTCCRGVQEVFRKAKAVKVRVWPEVSKPWSKAAESHALVDRPIFIATNTRGECFAVDGPKHIVALASRNGVARIQIVAGKIGVPGLDDGLLNFPTGITVLVAEPTRREFAIFADSGNRRFVVVTKAGSAAKKTREIRALAGLTTRALGVTSFQQNDGRWHLAFVSRERNKACAVGVAKLDDFEDGEPTKGTLVQSIDVPDTFPSPTDVSFHEGSQSLLVTAGVVVVKYSFSDGRWTNNWPALEVAE